MQLNNGKWLPQQQAEALRGELFYSAPYGVFKRCRRPDAENTAQAAG
jgi:hypothetical protein